MSAAKHGLPTSLTPNLLTEILRYEPRHWKALKPRLVRKRPTVWEDINLSDDAFYDTLHEHLKDLTNRRDFDTEAKRGDTKRRPLGLYRGIHQYYGNQLADKESFRERMPKKATPKEYVDAISYCDDDDRLTNVVWALREEDAISDHELSEIATPTAAGTASPTSGGRRCGRRTDPTAAP